MSRIHNDVSVTLLCNGMFFILLEETSSKQDYISIFSFRNLDE